MFVSRNENETLCLGERLARCLGPGSVVGLTGPLGAGKTVLVQGIARGLGVPEDAVRSPTFLTAAEYEGRLRIAHLDLYRHEETLPHPEWLAELLDGDGVALIEWFERLGKSAPNDVILIGINYGQSPEERRLELRADGVRSRSALQALAALAREVA